MFIIVPQGYRGRGGWGGGALSQHLVLRHWVFYQIDSVYLPICYTASGHNLHLPVIRTASATLGVQRVALSGLGVKHHILEY